MYTVNILGFYPSIRLQKASEGWGDISHTGLHDTLMASFISYFIEFSPQLAAFSTHYGGNAKTKVRNLWLFFLILIFHLIWKTVLGFEFP